MDNSAAYTVAQGTLITSALSAFATGLYAIAYRNPNYSLLAGAAALNSGITAATFFGLREYAISPTLKHARQDTLSLSWTDRRTHHLLDSGLSGAAAGGILRGWKSGPAAVLPGAATAATICVLLQYAFNEAGIARLRYASRHYASPAEPPLHHGLDYERSEPSPTLAQRMLNVIGVRKMADDEYLNQMKKTRDHHLRRMAQLEMQLEAERKDSGHNGQKG
ncbi:hypothetical protein APHAL10511_000964 [Amanita phalloides]|nr:hypothetical protein APHAL10511_000964 [Amanita phalloides]